MIGEDRSKYYRTCDWRKHFWMGLNNYGPHKEKYLLVKRSVGERGVGVCKMNTVTCWRMASRDGLKEACMSPL